MQPATEELIKKMQDDKDFAEQILTCKENDEAIVLAKEQGIDLTLENIVEVNEVLQFAQRQQDGELTEEELEQVAGGTGEWATAATAIMLTTVTLTIAVTGISIYSILKGCDGQEEPSS